MLITIVAVLVVLGGLIFFHELGHFAVARCYCMGVTTFSLGFGPKLFKFKKGKTEYALSLVPLGGYVALVGESDEAEIPEGFTKEESFALRPAWQRLCVVFAGPFANFLLAWLLYFFLAASVGTPILVPEVGSLQENSPAAKAGLLAGDVILAVDEKPISSWDELSQFINQSQGAELNLTVERHEAGEMQSIIHVKLAATRATRKTIFGEEETAWLVGIRSSGRVITKPESFISAFGAGFEQTKKMVALTWQGLVKLFERVVPVDQVGGPIMIAQLVGEQAKQGVVGLLALTALISINLGLLNLLPIPVLDGGTIFFCLFEIILRRPLPKKVQEYAMRVGLALLIGLMLLATWNDIARLIRS